MLNAANISFFMQMLIILKLYLCCTHYFYVIILNHLKGILFRLCIWHLTSIGLEPWTVKPRTMCPSSLKYLKIDRKLSRHQVIERLLFPSNNVSVLVDLDKTGTLKVRSENKTKTGKYIRIILIWNVIINC